MANKKVDNKAKKPFYKVKRNQIIAGIVGVIVILFILVVAFGSPSAKTVFSDMQETMLQTKSVTLTEDYKMSNNSDKINFKVIAAMNTASTKELFASGNFTIDLVSSGVPMDIAGEFIVNGQNKYVKFSKIASSDATLATSFQTVSSQLDDNWVKIRSNDSYTTFASGPIESLTSIMPIPFANLSNNQRKVILSILQSKDMFTIEESSKVEIGNVSAYKYSLKYNKDQYNKLEKALSSYVPYFKVSESNGGEIKTLNVWVNISTKQIVKMEFSGTSDESDIEGVILFSNYNKTNVLGKPSDYSIESELLQ